MKTKITKDQWLTIGNSAGWLTKQAVFLGTHLLEERREDPLNNPTFQTRKLPTLLEIGEPILPAEYSKLFNAVNSHDYGQVRDYLGKMTPDERKKLVQKLANTCKASILIMHECSTLGDIPSSKQSSPEGFPMKTPKTPRKPRKPKGSGENIMGSPGMTGDTEVPGI